MVEVNELRTGNLVKCKISNDAGIYTVQALDAINLKVYLSLPRNVWHTEDKIKGIKITEEWLIKLGAIKRCGNEIDIIGQCFEFEDNKSLYFTAGEGVNFSKKICFVHELQNYMFFAFGKELRLNE